jgi:hypothetical protein
MDGTPVFKDYVCTHHNLRSFWPGKIQKKNQ